ncbi:hypothetical protein [Brevibacillus reuszeri]|uniref:hypothetical protein n=1 Tax=Brevibacillus reuszeri TaxID=54915 RepID=UPI0028A23233|nr:hypothetical protein [Brevibacillus reuszeri]
MSTYIMTLLTPTDKVAPHVQEELAACGIVLKPWGTGDVSPEEAAGLLIAHPDHAAVLGHGPVRVSETPGLLLIYGEHIPNGFVDSLQRTYANQGSGEVVRMAFFCGRERVLLGGNPNGKWIRQLCRQLAHHGHMSMVCQMREVDEVIDQLPRYLAWKEQFFMELGEVCDQQGISLQRVSRALGMDNRIGQQWLYPDRQDHTRVCQWIEREYRYVLQKANVHKVALWGRIFLWSQMSAEWLADKEVFLYMWGDGLFPNEKLPNWTVCTNWEKTLENSDLLIIGGVHDQLRELPLHQLVRLMRQAIVVDATASFPIQEAQAYLKSYRTFGEKTNVWE